MNKEEIASLIMERFKEINSKPGHVLDDRWITFNLRDKLNPRQQLLVDGAIGDLVAGGQITTGNKSGMFCLELTELGYNEIYPIQDNLTKIKIGKAIMNEFVRRKSKSNDVIDQRWIEFNLISKLNPKEQELVDSAIDDLVRGGQITTENRSGIFCLVLSGNGFDEIYS